MTTVRGDIMHEVNDLPPDGLLLGPEIGLAEQATVRMRFVAERAMQQAGLLAFRNPDSYVKLGRQFLSRTELEFGLETGARYAKPAGTFFFDPAGQDGRPLWLSIRRDRQTFSAFLAHDGGEWRPAGNLLTAPPDFSPVRFAVFAHHGRSNTTPAVAEFDRASLGLEFETWPAGPADLSRFEGWAMRSTCDDSPQPTFDGTGLVFPAGKNASSCLIRFESPVPEGDWEFETKMDFVSQSGSTAGLRLDGDRRALRLIRWDVNGGSISAEHLGHAQVNSPDWDGNPPVVLRMQCRNGVVRSSFSRDGEEFRELPLEVGIGSFGKSPTIGIAVTRSSWTRETQPAPAKFYYIRRNLQRLRPYR